MFADAEEFAAILEEAGAEDNSKRVRRGPRCCQVCMCASLLVQPNRHNGKPRTVVAVGAVVAVVVPAPTSGNARSAGDS